MDNLLQVGDRFVSPKLDNMLHGEIARDKNTFLFINDPITQEPYVDFSTLHTENYECDTVASWTETKEGGWSRHRETHLSTKAKDPNLLGATWVVIKTSFDGGGCAHGPHDVFGDGHHVVAQRVGGSETVNFYQSGCFVGMLEPKDISLRCGCE
jgi:hypothetical protein